MFLLKELGHEERKEFDKKDKVTRLNQLWPLTTHEEKNEQTHQVFVKIMKEL